MTEYYIGKKLFYLTMTQFCTIVYIIVFIVTHLTGTLHTKIVFIVPGLTIIVSIFKVFECI